MSRAQEVLYNKERNEIRNICSALKHMIDARLHRYVSRAVEAEHAYKVLQGYCCAHPGAPNTNAPPRHCFSSPLLRRICCLLPSSPIPSFLPITSAHSGRSISRALQKRACALQTRWVLTTTSKFLTEILQTVLSAGCQRYHHKCRPHLTSVLL